MSRGGDGDACHGFKMRYVNPATGDWAMPTMGTAMQLLPRGFSGTPYRSSDSAVFVVVEGSGRTVINGETLEWRHTTLRGAELARVPSRGDRGIAAIQLFGPSGAGEAWVMARASRQQLTRRASSLLGQAQLARSDDAALNLDGAISMGQ